MAELQQRLAADIGGLEIARLRGRAFLLAQGIDERTQASVELVLEEAVTNTLRHGYRESGLRWIDLTLTVVPGEVVVRLEDDGAPFNPVVAPDPELPRSIEEARVGGLGLLMIRRSTSRMAYERRAGRNVLTLAVPRRAPATT